MHANFAAVQTVLIFLPSSVSSKLDRQSHQLLWQAVAKKLQPYSFSCRPNAGWLSLLDDFVTTNFGTRVPHARAPPGSKILATPLYTFDSYGDVHCTEQSILLYGTSQDFDNGVTQCGSCYEFIGD